MTSRNHARMPHCLRWGGMASLLGGLGDRFPQHNRELPSKSPAACGGDLYSPTRSPEASAKAVRPTIPHLARAVPEPADVSHLSALWRYHAPSHGFLCPGGSPRASLTRGLKCVGTRR